MLESHSSHIEDWHFAGIAFFQVIGADEQQTGQKNAYSYPLHSRQAVMQKYERQYQRYHCLQYTDQHGLERAKLLDARKEQQSRSRRRRAERQDRAYGF